MIKALIHRYDNQPDMLAIEKNRCSDVFSRSLDDEFEMVIVVPTRSAKTDMAIIAEALSRQYQPAEPRSWPGRPDKYVWRVDVGDVRQTRVDLIRQAFEEADLNWGGAWTIRNVSLPDWVRDLLDDSRPQPTLEEPDQVQEPSPTYQTSQHVQEVESSEELSALEGLLREQKGYTRTRDRGLRDQALERSKGICEVCEVNFANVLNGRGIHALQVHHRNQLALNNQPVVTKISDLAVVCATCHALIHMNSSQALKVEELREQLRSERRQRQRD